MKITVQERYRIKTLFKSLLFKGLCCGITSITIALLLGEKTTKIFPVLLAILLEFISYGLSILLNIKAKKHLGAAKTSSNYAVAPFVGSLLSFIILKEDISIQYFFSLFVMLVGASIVTIDTLSLPHTYIKNNTHTHDDKTNT